MKYAQRGATKFTRFSRSRNDFARTSHCARETSPSIVVHNVAGAEAARLENYDGAFSTSLSRASHSLPVTLVGTNNDLEKLKKALNRDCTPRDQHSVLFVVAISNGRGKKETCDIAHENTVKIPRYNNIKSDNTFVRRFNRVS